MDWVLLVLLLIILVYLVILHRRFDGVDEKLRVLNTKFSTRQSSVASRRASTGTPIVDAKARTTRRDSNDLPTTGRMSDGLHRRKRDARIVSND